MSSSILVLYYFQGELGESLEHPNAYTISTTSKLLKFHEFINSFPNPSNASYHFRFRVEDKLNGYCWLDIQDFDNVIPIHDGRIVAKILKLDDTASQRRTLRLKLKKNTDKHIEQNTRLNAEFLSSAAEEDYSSSQPSVSPPNRIPPQKPFKPTEPKQYVEEPVPVEARPMPSGKINKIAPPPAASSDGSSPLPLSTSAKATESKQTDDLLFGYEDNNNTRSISPQPVSSATASASATEDILFDFTDSPARTSTSPIRSQQQQPSATTSAAAAPAVTPIVTTTVTMDIDDDHTAAAASWHDGLRAPAVNKEVQELDELDAAKAKFDKSLEVWAYNLKDKRNIRTLLSSMHTVLWPGTTWKPIGLGDVLEPKQVKLQYRKAMLIVHPDRLSNHTVEVRFIGKRVFEAINEAYQEFLKKESV